MGRGQFMGLFFSGLSVTPTSEVHTNVLISHTVKEYNCEGDMMFSLNIEQKQLDLILLEGT
jgi:hypothetical protein